MSSSMRELTARNTVSEDLFPRPTRNGQDSFFHLFHAVSIPVSLPGGAIVFGEGDLADRVYFVRSGQVKLFTSSRNGRSAIFRFAGAGDLLGLSAILNGSAFECTARAIEASLIQSIRLDDFRELLATHAAVGRMVAEALAREHSELFADVRRLAFHRTVSARLAGFLLDRPYTAVLGNPERRLQNCADPLRYRGYRGRPAVKLSLAC